MCLCIDGGQPAVMQVRLEWLVWIQTETLFLCQNRHSISIVFLWNSVADKQLTVETLLAKKHARLPENASAPSSNQFNFPNTFLFPQVS